MQVVIRINARTAAKLSSTIFCARIRRGRVCGVLPADVTARILATVRRLLD